MPFPTFLCVGVMKCGTTTLYEYLREHPAVFIPQKEVDWFNRQLTPEQYAAMFSADYAVRGDLSPSYIYNIDEIAEFCPNVKMILLVRDPIAQFISSMRHRLAETSETFDIDEMLTGYEAGHFQWHVVISQKLIEKILHYGFPLHLINFDDLVHDQQTVFDRLCDFLAIPHRVTEYIHGFSSDEAGHEMVRLTRDQVIRLRRIHAASLEFLRQRYGIEFIEKYEITET